METVPRNKELRWDTLLTLEEQYAALSELVPVYQKAFAGYPWYEVSKCNCVRGYSRQKVGEICTGNPDDAGDTGCGVLLSEEAYPRDELLPELEQRVRDNPSLVYVERDEDGQAVMGAIAYPAAAKDVYQKKYEDKGRGSETIETAFSRLPEKIIWLDEIFADLERRPSGNLSNFEMICTMMSSQLGNQIIAFRTMNEGLIAKSQSALEARCAVEWFDDPGVPGKRSALVVINLNQ